MLLVLGSGLDDQPRVLVEHWSRSGEEAVLITPRDLSRRGWRLRRGRPTDATAATADRIIRATGVRAVVSALPWVGSYDLAHIVEPDRAYVAQEMTAFLLAWLSELECKVVDRPTSLSLAGCGRSQLEWSDVAKRLGIAAEPSWSGSTVAVTAVGGQPLGDAPGPTLDAAAALSRAAGRSLVTLRFARGRDATLVGADVRAEIGTSVVADALLRWLRQQ